MTRSVVAVLLAVMTFVTVATNRMTVVGRHQHDINNGTWVSKLLPNSATKVLRVAVIAPSDISHQYSLNKILPTITLAARKLERLGNLDRGPLPGWKIEILSRDSRCSSIYGPLEVFELHNQRAVGAVSFQLRDWTSTQLTSG